MSVHNRLASLLVLFAAVFATNAFAENVLQEPAESLPHDDHLHLRIACSPEASVQGCEAGGPYWSWLPALPAESTAAIDTAAIDTAALDTAAIDTAALDTDTVSIDTAGIDTTDLEELL